MHAAPQSVRPAEHDEEQTPAEQTSPGAHATPHPPQWYGSELSSTHSPPQGVSGAVHTALHVPALHVASAFAGAEQWTLQPPQWSGSSSSRKHCEPHAVNPGVQAKLQVPSMQKGMAPSGAVHVAPQPPQFRRSLPIETHSDAHRASPAPHSPMPA
jgi:hypothetical protein